ncbi:MAG: hypothetical protein WA804_02340, partial [Terriglobales bacterium]
RNVAEHSFLLIIVSAHSLASWTFLTSDEFLDLKLQKEWVFQQTASRVVWQSTLLVNARMAHLKLVGHLSGNATRASS